MSRRLLRLIALAWVLSIAACGGGGGDGGGQAPPPGSAIGSLSLGLAGGAPAGWRHVWVTVDAVALHADAERAWSAGDSSWVVLRLDSPRSVDLAAGSVDGVIAPLLTGRTLPAGTYGQMRLFVLRHDEPLAASAAREQLAYNAQAERATPDGTAQRVPLEIADAGLGLRVAGPIQVSPSVSTELTIQWDLAHQLVPFGEAGAPRLTLRPDLRLYDLAHTGAIIGLLDKAAFCSGDTRTGCVFDVVATAQRPSADGRTMEAVRSAPVVVGDTYAAFALYPLPALPAGETFDVVIRGRQMRTIVVRAVPAAAADLFQANPTQIGIDRSDPARPVPAPLLPVLSAAGDGQATLAAPALPRSARIVFGQTLAPGERPLEIAVAQADPFTGMLAEPVLLPSGPLRVASFAPSGALNFADVTPQEGTDGYSLLTRGTRYDEPSALAAAVVPGGGSAALAAPPAPRRAGIVDGALDLTLDIAASKYDAAQLVVADIGGIVVTQDVSALIGVAGATLSIAVPAGDGAVHAVSVRAWRRADPQAPAQWGRAASVADLRGGGRVALSVRVP